MSNYLLINFDNPPQLSVENEQYFGILDMYDKSLKEKLKSLQQPVSKFYDSSSISNQLLPIEAKIKTAKQAEFIAGSTILLPMILTIIFLLVTTGDWPFALLVGFFGGGFVTLIYSPISEKLSDYYGSKLMKYEGIYSDKKSQIEKEKENLLNLLNIR